MQTSDFGRLRVGIGNSVAEKADASDFVLGRFTKKEQDNVPLLLREINSLGNEFLLGNALQSNTIAVF